MSVTVITVCLNAAKTIRATLDSVRAQIDHVHEYVIVDGGSTDGTQEIIAASEAAFAGKLHWTSEPDAGIYDAMNKGLARATGDFIVFLGADDVALDGAFEAIVTQSASVSGIDLVYGDAIVVESGGDRRPKHALAEMRLVAGVPWSMPSCHQACAFSADAYRVLGGFDTGFHIAGDYEFYIRFHQAGLGSLRVNRPLVAYSLEGLSSRLGRATANEYRRARVLHGVPPARAFLLMARSLVYLQVARVLRRSSALQRFLA